MTKPVPEWNEQVDGATELLTRAEAAESELAEAKAATSDFNAARDALDKTVAELAAERARVRELLIRLRPLVSKAWNNTHPDDLAGRAVSGIENALMAFDEETWLRSPQQPARPATEAEFVDCRVEEAPPPYRTPAAEQVAPPPVEHVHDDLLMGDRFTCGPCHRAEQVGTVGGERDYCPKCDRIGDARHTTCGCGTTLVCQPDIDDVCDCGHPYGSHTYGMRGPCKDCSSCGRWKAPAQPASPPPQGGQGPTEALRADVVRALRTAATWSNEAGFKRAADELERRR